MLARLSYISLILTLSSIFTQTSHIWFYKVKKSRNFFVVEWSLAVSGIQVLRKKEYDRIKYGGGFNSGIQIQGLFWYEYWDPDSQYIRDWERWVQQQERWNILYFLTFAYLNLTEKKSNYIKDIFLENKWNIQASSEVNPGFLSLNISFSTSL